ncbi:MAG: protein kinase [Verrucomicrobia bacterium]|nr:protein kinase [Verrucomicrobiota bacterium]
MAEVSLVQVPPRGLRQLHPNPGEKIGGFTVVDLLGGQGTQSDIYLVEGDGGKAALKLYRVGCNPNQPVLSELQALAGSRLIVPGHTGYWEGRYYEVTPYFENGSLADWLAKYGPLSPQDIIGLASQLNDALERLHHAGLQHRDLKPANIVIRNGAPLDVALADFGSASLARYTLLTSARSTLAYSAPEAVTGLYSQASDYWSLGMVLLEAATGEHPLLGNGSSRLSPYLVASGKVDLPTDLPPRLRELFRGLLEPDHYKRWRGAEIRSWLMDNRAEPSRSKRFLLAGFFLLVITSLAGIGVYEWSHLESPRPVALAPPNPHGEPVAPVQPSTEEQKVTDSRGMAKTVATTPLLIPGLWVLAGVLLFVGLFHQVLAAHHGIFLTLAGLAAAGLAFFLSR